jgi:HK97 family phage major capsid protein
MEQKEFNQAIDSIKEVAVADATKAAETAVEKVKSDVFVKMDEIDARVKSIDAHLAEQKKFSAEQTKGNQSFGEIVGAELKKIDLKGFAENMKSTASFEVKAAGTITTGNYSGGTVGITQWDPSFALVPRREPFLRQIVTVRPVGEKYVAWAEQANRDGGAGQTAEGAAKSQADFDIVEASKKVEKITAYSKISKEALADLPFLQSEINSDLLSLVNLKLDADLLMGNGTTPALKGINEYATAFSVAGTALSLGIDNANEFDALRAAIWQVQNAYFQPNYIVLNPIDVAKMDMLKDTTNAYLVHQAAGQFMFRSYYGLPVIANNGVTAGSFFVGDFSKSNLGIREEVNIQIGYENDDFTKNLVTILAEMRAVHYVKSNHVAAIVKGTFSAAKTALETA